MSDSRVVGLGGLGHMAVKIGAAMGAHVTVISTSESKRDGAAKLGAKGFLVSKDPEQLKAAENSLDFIIDTVAAEHDVIPMINLLTFEGVYCMYVLFVIHCICEIVNFIFRVGAPAKPLEINAFSLIQKRPTITGSGIGGMEETQEMLDFCGKHGITCDIEKIQATPETIKVAYERTVKSDVKYRFVIDILNSFK
jgi:D-arabinose 1-dehydrogenase-like Zn-dependent alcohol dehydrogenase